MLKSLIFAIGAARCLIACECGEVTFREAVKYADVVFEGTVAHIDHMNPIVPPVTEGEKIPLVPIPRQYDDLTLVRFRVSRAWKGPFKREILVFATARPSMCDGYEFAEGQTYIVYASPNRTPEWELLKRFSQGATVYEVPDCPLRVRTDVDAERRRLGMGRTFR